MVAHLIHFIWGHVHCILQGANLCKEFFIVLSVGRNRDEFDYRMRYRWLYQLTQHIGNVKNTNYRGYISNKAKIYSGFMVKRCRPCKITDWQEN